MIPILYPAAETTFTGSGICALVDATRCIVTQDTDWTYTLEMDYPTNGRFFDQIRINRIILAEPAPGQKTEPFDIYSISVDETGLATVYAKHIYYRLDKVVIKGDIGQSMTRWLYEWVTSDDFRYLGPANSTFLRDTSGTPTSSGWFSRSDSKIRTAREWLLNYANLLQPDSGAEQIPVLEYKFRRFNIYAYYTGGDNAASRGTFKPVTISVGRNAKGLKYEIDYSNVVDYIIPYYVSSDLVRSSGYDKYVVFITDDLPSGIQTVNNETSTGQTSTYINVWINGDGESPTVDYATAFPVDLSSNFNGRPGPAALAAAGMAYYNNNHLGEPYVNLTIDYTELDPELEPEYEYAPTGSEPLLLCDTCTVTFDAMDLTATMKVVKTVYNVLLERYDLLEFGSLQRTIFDATAVSGTSILDSDYSNMAVDITTDTDSETIIDPDGEEIDPDDIIDIDD